MLFVLISCVCSYQVTYQLCHQISVNFPPLTTYWSSPITKNYFLTKQVCGRFVITSSIPYLESLYFLGSTNNKAFTITEGIIFPSLTFFDLRGVDICLFSEIHTEQTYYVIQSSFDDIL